MALTPAFETSLLVQACLSLFSNPSIGYMLFSYFKVNSFTLYMPV